MSSSQATTKIMHSQSVQAKKPTTTGVSVRETSKLQLIQRQNSQKNGLGLLNGNQKEMQRASGPTSVAANGTGCNSILSHRGSQRVVQHNQQDHQSQNNINIHSQQTSIQQLPPNSNGNNNLDNNMIGASRNSIMASLRRQQKIHTHQDHMPQSIANVCQVGGGAGNAETKSTQQQKSKAATMQLQTTSCMRDFHVHKKIGAGAYSEVYQVIRKSDGMEYALKQVKIQRLTEKEKENALNEVRILASINNVNVIAYKEAFFDEQSSTLCIVMEFAGMGDLYEKIITHQKSATEFSEREIWEALVQMTSGLKALHDRNIFHRDLKSANIFQSSDGTFKMGDLNVSKIAQDGLLYTQTGTPYYASPEVWQEKPYDNKSDIWSLGCIIYEMCSLNPPFRAKNMQGLYNSVLSGSYPKLPQHYSTELCNIIKSLLAVNPIKRPSCDQLLQHQSIVDFVNSRRNSTFSEPLNDQDKTSSMQDVLLKTIHCPRNLSQLSQILPRSKYQSGVSGLAQSLTNHAITSGQQQIPKIGSGVPPPSTGAVAHGPQVNSSIADNNVANGSSGSLPVFELPAQVQVPHTAATDERKGKRRKKRDTNNNSNQHNPNGPTLSTNANNNLPPNTADGGGVGCAASSQVNGSLQHHQITSDNNCYSGSSVNGANQHQIAGDRNHIIEMAQQIVLPPIRESSDSTTVIGCPPVVGVNNSQHQQLQNLGGVQNQPTMLQLQQQRQKELLGIRRKTNASNRSKVTIDASNEIRHRNNAAQQLHKKAEQQIEELVQYNAEQQQQENHNHMEKKKMKSQLQVRHQTSRPGAIGASTSSHQPLKTLKNNKQGSESQSTLNGNVGNENAVVNASQSINHGMALDNNAVAASANTNCYASQGSNSNMIELPPSINNIYATAAAMTNDSNTSHLNSRFNANQNAVSGVGQLLVASRECGGLVGNISVGNLPPSYSLPAEHSMPSSSRRLNEKSTISGLESSSLNMMNQPITINDLSHKQRAYHHQKLSRQGSSHHRIQQINEARQSLIMSSQQQQQLQQHQQQQIGNQQQQQQQQQHNYQHQVYSSQSNLIAAAQQQNNQSQQKNNIQKQSSSQLQANGQNGGTNSSNAGAHRYQSVGMLHNANAENNIGINSSPGILNSTNQTTQMQGSSQLSNQQHQMQQSSGGTTSLPGLKLNLQTMKSAKQLNKMTPNEQIMNSMKIRQSVKQQFAANESNTILPPALEKSNSNRNLIGLEQKNTANQEASTVHHHQIAAHHHQLPPRNHSTTRNGHGPNQRSTQQSKLLNKQGSVLLTQNNSATPGAVGSQDGGKIAGGIGTSGNNQSQRSLYKKNSLASSSQQMLYERKQQPIEQYNIQHQQNMNQNNEITSTTTLATSCNNNAAPQTALKTGSPTAAELLQQQNANSNANVAVTNLKTSKTATSHQMTPAAGGKQGSIPTSAMAKQRQKVLHTASQKGLKEADLNANNNGQNNHSLLTKNSVAAQGNSAIQNAQLPDSITKLSNHQKVGQRNQVQSSSINSRPAKSKLVNKVLNNGQQEAQHHASTAGNLTLSQPQVRSGGAHREKSQIMVELMPIQGNSSRINSKLNTGRNGCQITENFNQKMEQRTTDQESLRVVSRDRVIKQDQNNMKSNTIAPIALPKMLEQGRSHQGPMIKKATTMESDQIDYDEDNYTDPESPEKSPEKTSFKDNLNNKNRIKQKQAQLKQLRMQQQSILNKKSRKATLHQDSPSNQSQFTKAQYLEMPINHKNSFVANTCSSAVDTKSNANHLHSQQQLVPPDINSFEVVPKKSHRLLPTTTTSTKTGANQHQVNKKAGGQQNKSNTLGSNKVLPTLKNQQTQQQIASVNDINHQNQLQQNDPNLASHRNSAAAATVTSASVQQRARVDDNTAIPPLSTASNAHNQNVNNSHCNSLDKSKQQYLEQLRQLASIRHQKKQAGMKTQLSVQTKKNGGNKAAELIALSAQSAQQSPLSSGSKLVSQFSSQQYQPPQQHSQNHNHPQMKETGTHHHQHQLSSQNTNGNTSGCNIIINNSNSNRAGSFNSRTSATAANMPKLPNCLDNQNTRSMNNNNYQQHQHPPPPMQQHHHHHHYHQLSTSAPGANVAAQHQQLHQNYDQPN